MIELVFFIILIGFEFGFEKFQSFIELVSLPVPVPLPLSRYPSFNNLRQLTCSIAVKKDSISPKNYSTFHLQKIS